MFSAGYYCRTICYALLLQLGYANLALALVLLFNNRILGILIAIVALMQLNMLKNLGFLWNILSTISYASRDRDTLWMWAVDSQPTLSQLFQTVSQGDVSAVQFLLGELKFAEPHK